jgi:ribosomal-protein-alanine N-acetyltransferase
MTLALPLTGDRVVLRRFAATDLQDFQRYRHDPQVGRYQGWTPMDDVEAQRFIETMATAPLFVRGEWTQVAIAERETGGLVGDIGLHLNVDGTEAEIGFSMDPAAQGRGLATEAVRMALAVLFASTDVARVVATTDARNVPSIRLLERLGMQRVQTVAAMFRGEPCTEHKYSIERPQGIF